MVDTSEPHVTPRASRRRRQSRGRRRAIIAGLAAVVVLSAAAAFWILVQGLNARTTLVAAMPLASQVEDGIRSGDIEQARDAVTELRTSTADARASTSGPIWSVASLMPWVGHSVSAVSTMTAAIDDITEDVLQPLVEVAGSLDVTELAPVDGRIDLESLAAAEPSITAAEQAMLAAQASLDEIDSERLVDQVAGPVDEVRGLADSLAPFVSTGARAARLLPPMLGADEPRVYLVIFQNPAELRATGGLPGAFAIVEANNGRISLVDQGSSGDFGYFDEPVLPLDPGVEAIYTERLGLFFSGVNLTPDFPTAARLAAEMARLNGIEVDGVVATDPVALSYVLDVAGSVPAPGGLELTGDNAVSVLLSDVYWEIPDPRDQDVFLAAAAAAVFNRLTSGVDDPTRAVDALARAADERRLLVWSSRPDEQGELQPTVLSGAFDDESPAASAIGVFYNDGTSAKMQYYLQTAIEHVDIVCGPTERLDTISVTLTSTAPADAADLPINVTGFGSTGVPAGSMRTNVYLYGPESGEIRSVLRDGTLVATETYHDGNRPVRVHTAELAPGESVTFDVQLAQPHRPGSVEIWSTPTVQQSGYQGTAPDCAV